MPYVVCIRPFEKFEIRHEFGPDPNALLHLRGGKPFAPPTVTRLGKVLERTLIDDEGLEK